MIVDDGEEGEDCTVRLYGENISVLSKVKQEIELREETYEFSNDKAEYVKGQKYQNLTSFKENAGLVNLFMKKENDNISVLRAVGNEESLENFRLILDTHMGFYDQFREKHYQAFRGNKETSKTNKGY